MRKRILLITILLSVGVVVAIQNGCGKLVDGESDITLVTDEFTVTIPNELSYGSLSGCAIVENGKIKCWGAGFGVNIAGVISAEPKYIDLPQKATSVSVSGTRAIASLEDGSVVTWLNPFNYQATYLSPIVQKIENLGNMAQVELGQTECIAPYENSCGVRRDGTAQCWSTSYPVGANPTVSPNSVIEVTDVISYSGVAIANYSATNTTLNSIDRYFIKNDGTVLKSVGIGGNTLPTPFANLTDVKKVSAGGAHACALLHSGEVKCWGRNTEGQLGDTTNISSGNIPVSAFEISNAVDIAVSTSFSGCGGGPSTTCAALKTGRVMCWGHGYGSTPVLVQGLSNIYRVGKMDSMAANQVGKFSARSKTGEIFEWLPGTNVTPNLVQGL
jgi:Regulator of chromosome condensation (RCC1) repeat